MKVQAIQTYSSRVNSFNFGQSRKPDNNSDNNGRSSLPSGNPDNRPSGLSALAAAMIVAVPVFVVTHPKSEQKSVVPGSDSTLYEETFANIMKSPLISQPQMSEEELIKSGYQKLQDGRYSNGINTVKIDSDYYEIKSGDTEYTRPIMPNQGYSNIRVYDSQDTNLFTDYRYVINKDGNPELLQVIKAYEPQNNEGSDVIDYHIF